MSEKYSAWKLDQKNRHKQEIVERKAICQKWSQQKRDKAILLAIPVRNSLDPVDLKPVITPPKARG